MRLILFTLLSLGFWFCVYVMELLIMLRCGLGPDSPVACNDAADRDAVIALIVAGIIYLLGAAAFWRRSRRRPS
jgi:hypothetical protein